MVDDVTPNQETLVSVEAPPSSNSRQCTETLESLGSALRFMGRVGQIMYNTICLWNNVISMYIIYSPITPYVVCQGDLIKKKKHLFVTITTGSLKKHRPTYKK